MSGATKEHPILFSGEMVRAILAGRKTQTRRVVTDQNTLGNWRPSECDMAAAWVDPGPSPAGNPGPYLKARVIIRPEEAIVDRIYPRVQRGNRLWVRETWKHADWTEDGYPYICHAADNSTRLYENYPVEWADRLAERWAELSAPANYTIDGMAADRTWRPSIFMPRWACRLELAVTGIRVERVQDINNADAIAEGCPGGPDVEGYSEANPADPYEEYAILWDKLNAPRGFGWNENPWVWVIEITRAAA